jgi:hypothetical protein
MRLSYDRAEDILTVETTATGTIDHAEQTGSFIAHFDVAGQLVLLEVLDASDILASVVKVTARGTAEELPAKA